MTNFKTSRTGLGCALEGVKRVLGRIPRLEAYNHLINCALCAARFGTGLSRHRNLQIIGQTTHDLLSSADHGHSRVHVAILLRGTELHHEEHKEQEERRVSV